MDNVIAHIEIFAFCILLTNVYQSKQNVSSIMYIYFQYLLGSNDRFSAGIKKRV